LGPFEQAVLMAVFRLKDGAYGRTIHDELEDRLTRVVSMGAMYSTLERLNRDGLLASAFAPGPSSRGGRSRRYYTITGAGVQALNNARKASDALWAGAKWPLGI